MDTHRDTHPLVAAIKRSNNIRFAQRAASFSGGIKPFI
jgi:hypothetical protein